MPNITFSRKQNLAFGVLTDPFVVELLFGGGAGGGKSLLVTTWMAVQCKQYPGITIGLARKEISNLGKTTVQTLLTEAHPLLGVVAPVKGQTAGDYRYVAPGSPNPGIYYSNGSSILLLDLAPAPSDPNYDRFGSLPLTHVVIEEIGELTEKAVNAVVSRKDRKLNREYNITGKAVMTCNPSYNFARERFYEPYVALGAGEMQSWTVGEVTVDGVLHPDGAKRAFIQSLPTDNPFLSPNYIANLKRQPEAQRRRLLEGDWDFDSDEGKLISAHLIRTTPTYDSDEPSAFGCDPSRGGDGCVFVELKAGVVIDAERLEIPKDDPKLDIGTFVAQAYIDWVTARGGGYESAALDAVGIGASVLDACTRLGWYVNAFVAASTKGIRLLDRFGNIIDDPRTEDKKDSIPLFNNIRSQNYSDMAEEMKVGTLLFLDTLKLFSEFRKDLSAHMVTNKERQTIIESKPELKKRLGRSPDYSDALLAAYWIEKNRPHEFIYEPRAKDDEEPFSGYGASPRLGGLPSSRF